MKTLSNLEQGNLFIKIILVTLFIFLFKTLMFGQDTVHTLSSIEIEGVRANSKTPVSQKTISKEEIQKGYFGQDAPVLFQTTPGIILESDAGNANNGYMYYRIRGIDQTRINVTLNGISIVEPGDEGGYFSNYTDFLSSINSVQIQRGVGTSSNGTASYAGSVNFESANLLDSAYTNVQMGGGSYNASRMSAGFNTGLMKNNFAFYGRFTTEKNDGFRNHSGYDASSFFFSGGYYGKTNTLKFTSFKGDERSGMAYLASDVDSIKKDYRNNPLSTGETDHFVQTFAQLQDIKKINNNSNLTSSIYYIGLQGNYGVLGMFGPATMSNFQLNSNLYGATTNYSYEKGKFRMNVGANAYYYYRDHAMDSVSLLPKTQSYLNRETKQEISAYAKISYDIKKFTLFGDIQERDIKFTYNQLSGAGDSLNKNYVNWSFFNPKAGITYNQTKNLNYYFSVGQEHREPTRTSMFQGGDNINPSIKELPSSYEQMLDYELGTNYKGNKLYVQADLFYMKSTNEFTPIGPLSQWTGLPLMIQVPNSWRKGIEFDASYSFSKHFKYYVNATYMKGQLQETGGINVSPTLTPDLIVNHGVECFYKRFAVGLSGRYVSASYIDLVTQNSLLTVPAMPMSNLFANNGFVKIKINKNCNLSFNVNNIVNSKYYTSGYAVNGNPYYFVIATRNYFVSLNAIF